MTTFLETAEIRKTSPEIMEAILAVAGGDEKTAERVWDSPTPEEGIAIWERVTGNGSRDDREYYWGAYGDRWAYDLGINSSEDKPPDSTG
jgi:hypothetical protein